MIAGEIIKQVHGLTHDKLTYFVRCGYIKPEKVKRGSLFYNVFTHDDLSIIKRAWGYIKKYDMKTRSAFDRAVDDIKKSNQLDLFGNKRVHGR